VSQALLVANVSKDFSAKVVVDRLSFDVRRGEVMGLLGPNGAGKSTTIRMILGIIKPDAGQILFPEHRSGKIDHSRIGFLPEERGFYKNQRILDVLVYLASLRNYPREKAVRRVYEYCEKLGLKGREKSKMEEVSKGMAQKVQFIASVLHEPDFLILDEPFSGLDPISQDVIKTEIRSLADSGMAILLSAHQMNMVEALCNRIFLIDRGKKLVYGEMQKIKEDFADFKCEIVGEHSHFDFTSLPLVESTESQNGITTVYFKKEANPIDFLRSLPLSLEIAALHLHRISLHDIFVNLVTGGGEHA